MGGELAVGTIVNQENLAKAKMICSGFKALIINYKNKSCKRLNFRHGYKNPRPHFCNRSTLIIHI